MALDKQDLIKITEAVYKVTGLLPSKEPLKRFIRQKGLLIFAKGVILAQDNPIALESRKANKLKQGIFENIAALEACFDLAQGQGWVNEINFVVLSRAYQDLKQEIEQAFELNKTFIKAQGRQEIEQAGKSALSSQKQEPVVRDAPWQGNFQPKPMPKPGVEASGLKNKRHRKIIGLLQKSQKAQIKDLEKHFPQTSKRTLRRDMGYLVETGFLKRVGDRNDTFYQLLTR